MSNTDLREQQYNQQPAEHAARIGNVNTTTPFGAVRYYGTPGHPDYHRVETLNPALQTALYWQQQAQAIGPREIPGAGGAITPEQPSRRDHWPPMAGTGATPGPERVRQALPFGAVFRQEKGGRSQPDSPPKGGESGSGVCERTVVISH